MKKVAFMFVAALAISFASCGNGQKNDENSCDSTSCCAAQTELSEEPATEEKDTIKGDTLNIVDDEEVAAPEGV